MGQKANPAHETEIDWVEGVAITDGRGVVGKTVGAVAVVAAVIVWNAPNGDGTGTIDGTPTWVGITRVGNGVSVGRLITTCVD